MHDSWNGANESSGLDEVAMFGYPDPDDGPDADEYGWWWCDMDADNTLVAMTGKEIGLWWVRGRLDVEQRMDVADGLVDVE